MTQWLFICKKKKSDLALGACTIFILRGWCQRFSLSNMDQTLNQKLQLKEKWRSLDKWNISTLHL